MKVNVVFFGGFARFKPAGWTGKRGVVDVPEGATIDRLASQLGIGEEPCVVMLNDEQHHRGAELHEGDTVTFLPPIAGGAGDPLARYQRQAAELLLEDEAWRDGLTDEEAAPLLDWALEQTDACIAREAEAGHHGSELEACASAAAAQARTLLHTLVRLRRGEPEARVRAELARSLAPPLFVSADHGQAAVRDMLATAGAAGKAQPRGATARRASGSRPRG